MLLSNQQINDLLEVIDYYHTYFIADNIGADILTPNDVKLLNKFGINLELFDSGTKYLDNAFKFGMLTAVLKDKRVKNMSFYDLKRFIASGNFVPLTPSELMSLRLVKQQAYKDIKGLGNRIYGKTLQVFIEQSKPQRIKYEKLIEKQAEKAVENRWSVNKLASELGHASKDWSRDFDRISDYIMHSVFQQGIANQLLRDYGEDVEVYYSVYKDACVHCVETYLTDGPGSEPKVFKLKDILANGSNIGVKAKDYKPSVDPLHPFCRCTMHLKPANSVWDKVKKEFVIVRNTYGIKRKSKVQVTITRT